MQTAQITVLFLIVFCGFATGQRYGPNCDDTSDCIEKGYPDAICSQPGNCINDDCQNKCYFCNCTNNATCEILDNKGTFECHCQDGFNGTYCENDIDECAGDPSPCPDAANGGYCNNTYGSFVCGCCEGYTSADTDPFSCTDVNECQTAFPCGENAICTHIENPGCGNAGFICECCEGFTGDGYNCTDIDECADGIDHCISDTDGGICTNIVPSCPGEGSTEPYTCSCCDGYEGDGTTNGTGCTDIDECADGLDHCISDSDGGICSNLVPSCPGEGSTDPYTCSCCDGYSGDGTTNGTGCTDIDECADGLDHCISGTDGGSCSNLVPSCPGDGSTDPYTCSCCDGYEGDGTTNGTGCTEIDECADGIDHCVSGTDGGICTNLVPSCPGDGSTEPYSCSCCDGYEGDGTTNGTGCTDIDECADGIDHCLSGTDGGICTNLVPSCPGDGATDPYTCSCCDGYEGDGTTNGTGCTDIDECADGLDHCVSGTDGGICSNLVPSCPGDGATDPYTCSCCDGYEGDGTTNGTGCTDIDECAYGIDHCVDSADGGICTNLVPSCPGEGSTDPYTCSCCDGYSGDGTTNGTGCIDIDECADGIDHCVDSADGGICTNLVPSCPGEGSTEPYTCSCCDGYSGDGTTNGTGCTDIDECADGIDHCLSSADGGICTNLVPSCEGDGDTNPYTCECCVGLSGDGTTNGTGCTDIDECAEGLDHCVDSANGGICTNLVPSCPGEGSTEPYTCGCCDGYSGDGTTNGTGCTEIDECADGLDHCVDSADGGICTNLVPSCPGEGSTDPYTCSCCDGYSGDGTTNGTGCTDIDECAEGINHCLSSTDGGVCTNLVPSCPGEGSTVPYTCSCCLGFSGDGTTNGTGCADIDECGSNPCHPEMDCDNLTGGYDCYCPNIIK